MTKYTRECSMCGKAMAQTPRGAALPVCHPCRRANPQRAIVEIQCGGCGVVFMANARRKYCTKACQPPPNKGISKYGDTHHRRVRTYREQDAPGLTYTQRKALLHTWIAQRRACTYCPRLASTIDHVLPLYRGGTNHEGNLTPCCKPCNSSKRDRYIIEWKTGRMAPSHTPTQRMEPKAKAIKEPSPPKPIRYCRGCGEQLHGLKTVWCSDKCYADVFRVMMRNRYRERVGIPLDAPIYRRQPETVGFFG